MTAQHSTAQHSTAQHSTAQHSTAQLRPATILDAELLLAWRNDPATREASHNNAEISLESHTEWLEKALDNPNRNLYIFYIAEVPVGTVRADFEGKGYELSWTVAPTGRGQGVGARMVKLLAEKISAPIRAEIKKGNIASVRIAETAGMCLVREADGVLFYQRD